MTSQPALIPRRVLFGNPDKTQPRISPDGTKLGFLSAVDGVLNVWVAPIDDLSAARPVTHDATRGIRSWRWCYTSTHLVYLQDKGGDENWRVYCVNLDSGDVADLTPFDGVQARIEAVGCKFPDEILISVNNRTPELHDLYRVNIRTGARTLVYENEGFMEFATDEDYRLRFATAMREDGGMDIHCREGEEWRPFMAVDAVDSLTTQHVGFDLTGDTLYWLDSRGRNTSALVAMDVKTGATEVLHEDPRADLYGVERHPTTRKVQAASVEYEREEWTALDPAIAPDLDYLKRVADGELQITSRTQDDSRWIVAYVCDDGPVRYYRYDRDGGRREAEFLFVNRQELEGQPLAKMRPVVIPSRDGLNLVCYLTLPLAADHNGRPAPMVLLVHGGPWHRDSWGFHPWHQWLANRGYAVLSVNFRGSTGFGKDFTNAGDKQWSAKMHDDLLDAVEWAVSEQIAQRDKIAIMGGSYGGYATLAGLTFTPETFACGVDIVGPSNIVTLLESIPDYWKPMISLFTTRVGDHRTEEGRAFLRKCSPLTHVDRICRPLLIGQGANDPRVKQAESDQIVAAMQEKGIPVTYVLFPDEGHGFARPENNMSFSAVAEAFLAQHLGGRYEPVGADFENASIQVPAGAEQVPGLKDALPT